MLKPMFEPVRCWFHRRTIACVPLCAILSLVSSPARNGFFEQQDAHKPKDVSPSAGAPDKERKCGLGAAFHAGRRALLLSKLDTGHEGGQPGGIVVVRGMPTTRSYTRFSQDKTFWYLTGVESPNAALVMEVRTRHEILFLPKADARLESWEGELWDAQDEWVPSLTGFEDVRPSDELMPVLRELSAGDKTVWITKQEHVELSGCHDRAFLYDKRCEKDPLDGRASREDALEDNLHEKLEVEVRDMAPILAEIRRVKTAEEIGAMRRAAHAGSMAMSEGMRSTFPGLGEWELDALMTFVHRREGASGPAYYPIVGSGPNALRLHYSEVSRVLRPGEIVLVDYAPEFDHYTSDITRSWPTDGVFTPRMAEIYDAVLAAQEAGIAVVKPGKTMDDVNRACKKVLQSRSMGKLMRHGACHYIGMEVHDVGDNAKPLEPGVTFTVEPGVYEESSGIGIRIEDVVVVTETGCEVLSAEVPKDRKTVVELIASEGLLDRSERSNAPLPEPSISTDKPRR